MFRFLGVVLLLLDLVDAEGASSANASKLATVESAATVGISLHIFTMVLAVPVLTGIPDPNGATSLI